MKLSRVIAIAKSDVLVKGPGQWTTVEIAEVKTKFAPIRAFPDHNSNLN